MVKQLYQSNTPDVITITKTGEVIVPGTQHERNKKNKMKVFRAYIDRYGDLIFEEKYSYRLWWKTDNGKYMSTTGDVCTRDELFTTGCAIEYAGGRFIVTDDGLLKV